MTVNLANMVRETTITQGTGTYTLAGSEAGFQSFTDAFGAGTTAAIYYRAYMPGGDWEIHKGTFDSTGPTLTRDTLDSSSTGSAINWPAAPKFVEVTLPASEYVVASENLAELTDAPTALDNLGAGATGKAIVQDATAAAVLTELGIDNHEQVIVAAGGTVGFEADSAAVPSLQLLRTSAGTGDASLELDNAGDQAYTLRIDDSDLSILKVSDSQSAYPGDTLLQIYPGGEAFFERPVSHRGLWPLFKESDETVNNSTTYQDDDDISFEIPANQDFSFRLVLLYNSSAVANIKLRWTLPSGAAIKWWFGSPTTAAGVAVATGEITSIAGTGADAAHILTGVIITSASPGTAQLQWAQNTAEVSNTKVLQGTHLIAHRVEDAGFYSAIYEN